MKKKVLVLGGSGRIGSSVARDIYRYCSADITICGRKPEREISDLQIQKEIGEKYINYISLDVGDRQSLHRTISQMDLVVHCAGPFHFRDTQVLASCIELGVNYVDVSDHRSYTAKALQLYDAAQSADITAVVNTGIFPGISNSMVRQCVEELDSAETIHLSYVVAGSGGAGITVMRTTFLGLQNPFSALINGEWQQVKPYTEREMIEFPQPYGCSGVYWYDMPETFTLAHAFPSVKNVVTKFGSVPDFYNHLTWIAAHIFPKSWIKSNAGVEFLSHVSHRMTDFTDRFSGIGVAVRASVTGTKNGEIKTCQASLMHPNTAISAGCGTGSIAQLLLSGELNKPGVHPVEAALPTSLFLQTMRQRGISIAVQG